MNGSETERIIKIIKAVEKHECLWNVNCIEYAKRDRLERAWNEVAQEVGKSDVFCREKWRNVRTGFLRSVQHQIRINHDESVPSDFHTTKRKRFYLYDQMAFLIPTAETLEMARKRRKLSRDLKSIAETDDLRSSTDDCSDNIMPEYGAVGKFEDHDNDVEVINDDELEAEEEEEEHHTFERNIIVNAVDNEDDRGGGGGDNSSNYEEILKEMENMANCSNSVQHNQQPPPLVQYSATTTVRQSQNDDHSPTTRKVIHLISEQLNEEISNKSTNVNNSSSHLSTTIGNAPSLDQTSSLSTTIHRDERQLINFFRGSIDDILALDKRKQRLFKKRMLDLINELHDS